MGREIRRVPLDWVHPKWTEDNFKRRENIGQDQPLYDKDYQTAAEEWMDAYAKWHKAGAKRISKWARYFWEEDSPPDAESYRARRWTAKEATAYQVYETVSEGTPVTPVFATKEQLIDYLVAYGDGWDQQRGEGGWDRTSAERFVERGSAFSLIVENFPGQPVKIMAPREQGGMMDDQAKPEPQETREEELARRRREGRVIWMLGVEITGAEADAISADGP